MTNTVSCIRRFRRLHALVIGDAMLDTYYEGTAARLCSEGPVPVVRKLAEHQAPGGAANTAANLRALGAEVRFLTILGDDRAGQLVRDALRQMGIADRWLITDPAGTTPHKMRILADGHYVVRFDDEQPNGYSADAQAQVLAALKSALAECDVIVISDYGYGVASDTLIAHLRELVIPGKPILIDSKDLLRFRELAATVVTPNLKEAQLLMAHDPTINPRLTQDVVTLDDIETIGRHIVQRINVRCAAVTLAEQGVLLVTGDTPAHHLPAHPVVQMSDVGAGDSFTSGMALALAAGADLPQAAQIALDAASIAVGKRWTAVVTQRELLQRAGLRDAATPAGTQADELARLVATLQTARRAGQRIVFANGIFDVLHAGHVRFLRQAKALGDVLVVGLNSDRSIRALNARSGARLHPLSAEADRLALVAALDPVDHVIRFDEETPVELIRALRPHLHVKGGDYADEALPEAEAVREYGGKVIILPLAEPVAPDMLRARMQQIAADMPSDALPGGMLADAGASSAAEQIGASE
jgi:D-beta-D-heptose 7-phosphate kinase/D-beta-D-heptose 1-phosphate adenosyltransferase